MTNSKFIPIQSVMYDLSLTIDDRYWNEIKFLEWANAGYRKLNLSASFVPAVCQLNVITHKATLPSNFKFLTQVAEYTGDACGTDSCNQVVYSEKLLDEYVDFSYKTYVAEPTKWRPMRMTSNPYHDSICLDKNLINCTDCLNEFSIDPSTLIVTTTLKSGLIMVAYLGYPGDKEGNLMIPDNQDVKDAIFHYVLYKHWMSKYQMSEDGSDSKMKFHLSMWQTAAMKAKNVDLPDVNTLENILAQQNKMLPRTQEFRNLFLTLGNSGNGDY